MDGMAVRSWMDFLGLGANPGRGLTLCVGLGLGWGLACAGGTGSEDVGLECDPGEGMMCVCPNGQTSVAWCKLDGSGFADCECEAGDEGFGDETGGDGEGDTSGDGDGDGDTGDGDGDSGGDGDGDSGGDGDGDTGGDGDGDTGGDGDGDGEPAYDEICYPGPAEDFSVCFPLVTPAPSPDYDYPAPYLGNVNYRAPIRYLDLSAINQSAQIAPNFTLDEVAQVWKGQYAVVSPAAIERIQDLRDIVGPIIVNSGYRNPAYNQMVGGATHSRHRYGDAFDLDPVDVALSTLECACTGNAGFLVEYETHVHCDWRNVDVNPAFFGLPSVVDPRAPFPVMSASLEHDSETGRWTAPAWGFDEGEPLRRWTALDAGGEILAEARGVSFVAPEGARVVSVIVGAQVRLQAELERP